MAQMRRCSVITVVVVILALTIPVLTPALTPNEIRAATRIVNLEGKPVWFRSGQPIDFVATVRYDGGTQDGFDVGVFHEGRLVGWVLNKRLNGGLNTFVLRDQDFRGDAGDYVVKVRFHGEIFTEKRFTTRRHQIPVYFHTLDPGAPLPQW
jgi:hypothetical protein